MSTLSMGIAKAVTNHGLVWQRQSSFFVAGVLGHSCLLCVVIRFDLGPWR